MLCTSVILNNSSTKEAMKCLLRVSLKLKKINKDVLDSEWTLTSCALRLHDGRVISAVN